jgi:hypothetical protein
VNENAVKGADGLERECEFAADMKRFLRDELKCAALVSDLNGGDTGLGALYPRYREYDYVDEHFYFAHPRFSGPGWTMPKGRVAAGVVWPLPLVPMNGSTYLTTPPANTAYSRSAAAIKSVFFII